MPKAKSKSPPKVNPLVPEPLCAASPERAGCATCGLRAYCQTPYMLPFVPEGWTGDYLLVGEAPGQDEDTRTHRPFTGDAGRLLRQILQKTIDPAGTKVAFTNAARCRPRKNATPTLTQIRACRPFLLEVIGKLRPRNIVALGTTALRAVTNQGNISVTALRGQQLTVGGMPDFGGVVWATYHPAAVLHGSGDGAKFHVTREMIAEDLVRRWNAVGGPLTDSPLSRRRVAVDTEYTPDGDLLDVALADSTYAKTVPVRDAQMILDGVDWLCGHAVAGDVSSLLAAGLKLDPRWLTGERTLCSLLLSRMIDENQPSYKLESLVTTKFSVSPWKAETDKIIKATGGLKEAPPEVRAERCRIDAWASALLVESAKDYALANLPLVQFTHRVAATLERVCLAGLLLDLDKFAALGQKLEAQRETSGQMLAQHAMNAGMAEFAPTNDGHVREFLFTRLGLTPLQYTAKKGLPAVDQITLKSLTHPAAALLLEFNKVDKLRSTYIEGLRELYHVVGKDRAYLPLNINPLGARTGRRTSNDPNCQNWPSSFRQQVTCSRWPGGKVVSFDYSKLEVIIIAYLAGEERLYNYFTRGAGYIGVAKDLYRVDVAKDTPVYTATKAAVLGTNYRMGPKKLAWQLWYKVGARLGNTYAEHLEAVRELHARYLRMFPKLRVFQEEREAEMLRTGQVRQLLGRVRRLPCPDGEATPGYVHMANEAANFPVQSLASDILGSALIDVETALLAAEGVTLEEHYKDLLDTRRLFLTSGPGDAIIPPTYQRSTIINEIHDELTVDIPPDHAARDTEIIVETMRAVPSLRRLINLPIQLNIDIG